MRKAGALVMIAIALVLMSSCSTYVKLWRGSAFSDPRELGPGHLGILTRFIPHVRPIQGNPGSHYLLACYYQERGEHEKALEELEKVLLIDPKHVRALNGMGVSYDQLKDYSRADTAYQRALQLDPGLDYIQNNLGYSYFLQGRIDEAITMLQKAIALNSREARFHNNLGVAFAAIDRLDLALNEFILAGSEAQAHYNIAQFYYQRGIYRVAQDHYLHALRLDPSFNRARLASEAADAMGRVFQTTEKKTMATRQSLPVLKNTPAPTLAPHVATVIVHVPPQPVKKKAFFEQSVGIEVSNGNGVAGVARRLAHYLCGRGLAVSRITNAEHFNHRATTIYYRKGYYEAALRLAGEIPGSQDIKQQKSFDRSQINVKVVIGKDNLFGMVLNEGEKS